MKVRDMQPGDWIDNPVVPSVLVLNAEHPLAAEHRVLVWYVSDNGLMIETWHEEYDMAEVIRPVTDDTLSRVCKMPELTPRDI